MASDDTSGGKPAGPVVLRIKLRYDDVEAMVQRFAPNVGKSGLFLPTKSIQPLGTEIKFELRIANDTPVLVGLGKVKAFREPDPANPKAAFGMAIELMRVTREGRELIMRMIERRRAMGLADVAIPMPEDLETARRVDVETQPRIDIGSTVRESQPTSEPGEAASAGERRRSEKVGSGPSPAVEQLLTSPRPSAGPIARARTAPDRPATPVLEPEPARPKRPRVADLLARASSSGGTSATVTVPGLDEHVDVERALARARALTSGDVESDLAALRESSAAPLAEISVEAASAELAKQLGGVAIRRDRSARWAPPPAVEVAAREAHTVTDELVTPVTFQAAATYVDAEPDAESDFRAPSVSDATATSEADAGAHHEHRRPATSSNEMDQLAAEAAAAVMARRGSGVHTIVRVDEAPPEPVVPHHLPEPDLQPPEPPPDAATDPGPMLVTPSEPGEAASAGERRRSEVTPRPALLIDDDSDLSSFERALDAARVQTGVSHVPAPALPDDDGDFDELDSMDLEELPGESTQIGDSPLTALPAPHADLADRLDQQLDAAEAEANADFPDGALQEPAPARSPDFSDEEISDLDVLAEANADDADLLQSDGEADASGRHELPTIAAPVEADDFASRLDLGDDEPPPESPDDFDRNLGELPRHASRGHELGQYDPGYDDSQSSSYTFAENPNQPTFDDPRGFGDGEDFDEPHQFSINTPQPVTPRRDSRADSEHFGANSVVTRSGEPDDLALGESFDEPHGFENPAFDIGSGHPDTPIAAPPPYRPPAREQVAPRPSVLHSDPKHATSRPKADYELEDALSTLDVDLDNLEIPRDQRGATRPLPGMPPERDPGDTQTVRPGSRSASVRPSHAAKRPKRAVTDDGGVLIDFDDDDDDL